MSAELSAPARAEGALRIVLPIALLALGVLIWDLVVRLKGIPPYVLPGPGLVFTTLVSDWSLLSESLLVTLLTTFEGFLLGPLFARADAALVGVSPPSIERDDSHGVRDMVRCWRWFTSKVVVVMRPR